MVAGGCSVGSISNGSFEAFGIEKTIFRCKHLAAGRT